VADYRAVLAENLVGNLTYNADAEMATLELLKIRFGDDALHSCAVMLRDLDESRRVNLAVQKHAREAQAAVAAGARAGTNRPGRGEVSEEVEIQRRESRLESWVDIFILSDHYWPQLPASELKLPAAIQTAFDNFSRHYAAVKKPRHLQPILSLGSVDLSLDFDDGSTRHFTVTPAQASIVLLLVEAAAGNGSGSTSEGGMEGGNTSSGSVDGALSLTQLALLAGLGEEEDEVHRAAAFWVTRG
jgi:anaphase-promoting complex subunit 2